ncbi:MAG: hypothetical protein GXO63_01520, partial [Candidatus Micrarchaeota archaeon]|nr:hypothetical protein [Candidatus Micrarchaeota archaeon]
PVGRLPSQNKESFSEISEFINDCIKKYNLNLEIPEIKYKDLDGVLGVLGELEHQLKAKYTKPEIENLGYWGMSGDTPLWIRTVKGYNTKNLPELEKIKKYSEELVSKYWESKKYIK